jgi:hypothetical protein
MVSAPDPNLPAVSVYFDNSLGHQLEVPTSLGVRRRNHERIGVTTLPISRSIAIQPSKGNPNSLYLLPPPGRILVRILVVAQKKKTVLDQPDNADVDFRNSSMERRTSDRTHPGVS